MTMEDSRILKAVSEANASNKDYGTILEADGFLELSEAQIEQISERVAAKISEEIKALLDASGEAKTTARKKPTES